MTKLLAIPGGWKRIPEYPDYVLGPDGRVKNAHTGKPMSKRGGGMGTVKLVKDGKQHEIGVRGLMRELFPNVKVSR